MLSFLTYSAGTAEVRGLDAFPRDDWPDNIPLLYYATTSWSGSGRSSSRSWRSRRSCSGAGGSTRRGPCSGCSCWRSPFPYIANTAGWMTAELGRQPWLVYGLMRTADGLEPNVSARERAVHAARLHGDVRAARPALPVPGRGARSSTGPGPDAVDRAGAGEAALMETLWFASSRSCSPSTSSSTASTSAPASSTSSSRGPTRARHGAPRDRSGLGRQRGVAARRGRRALFRVPAALRRRASAASICR